MAHNWGTLTYVADGNLHSHDIFITSIAQPHTLTGDTAQSKNMRHFYPRSHMPGDIAVTGFCKSQASYQELAYFIRHHQRLLLNTPNDIRYQFPNSNDSRRLMRLDVPTENNHWGGFIKTFGMTKKGVFVPAPTYTFNFVVVFDNTSENVGLSNRTVRNYAAGTRDTNPSTPGTTKVGN